LSAAVTQSVGQSSDATRPSIELRPCHWDGFSAIVELHGEHDLSTSEAVRVALARLRGHVLVDLSDCTFIDSKVIGTIVAASQALARERYRLELVLPPPGSHVRRALEVVGLPDLLARGPMEPDA
jgi:anti-anti-sigma factor